MKDSTILQIDSSASSSSTTTLPASQTKPLRFKNVLITHERNEPFLSRKRRKVQLGLKVEKPSTDESPKWCSPWKEPGSKDWSGQSNKVLWIDIGSCPNQSYWWPGLIHGNDPDPWVSLISDSEDQLIDSNLKSLSSFKSSKPFTVHSNFEPIKLNPILDSEKSHRSAYPSEKSLEKAYVVAREKHIIYSFEGDEDDLPELSACLIPLSQESKAVLDSFRSQETVEKCNPPSPELAALQEQGQRSPSPEDSTGSLEDLLDEPDYELEIPGETVLSRVKTKTTQYWPAKVIGYAGLKKTLPRGRRGCKTKKIEKQYQLEFCDRKLCVVPRSFFWTADQDEFYQVQVGDLLTKEVKFETLVPIIQSQLPQLDSIINGSSTNPEAIVKHDHFFNSLKRKGDIPKNVKYAKYGEDLIQKFGDYLRLRYVSNNGPDSKEKVAVDDRFEKLPEAEKNLYIFDILVPELIWLMTVEEYLEDAREELEGRAEDSSISASDSTMAEKLLARARELAKVEIEEVDLVDKVIGLRVRKQQESFPSPSPL